MAPFDKILVTCGAPFIPEDLLAQLKVGGRLVIPVGEGEIQKMTLMVRTSETTFEKSTYGDFSFLYQCYHKRADRISYFCGSKLIL